MHAIILAGGSGSRFWPVSRELFPKQFLTLFGGESLLTQSLSRISRLIPPENVYIVTTETQEETLRWEVRAFSQNASSPHIIAEPAGRNTAAAIGLASLYSRRADPEAVAVILPSDHLIRKNGKFVQLLKRGERAAQEGFLVTLGITPTRPETGFGYIRAGSGKRGKTRRGENHVLPVSSFSEKPDQKTATRYLKKGGYYWNSGIFLWKASLLLEEVATYLPDLYKGLIEIDGALGTKEEKEVIREVYTRLPSISVDCGILERSRRVVMLPADIGWTDLGSWRAVEDVAKRDRKGNIVQGNVLDLGSQDSTIYAEKRLVATIGLKGMVVVDTPDATLVCSKDRVQEVKEAVSELKKRGAEEHRVHKTVYRPWGSYTVLEQGPGYKIKRIVVNPGARLSLQMHRHRSEHWVVISGIARVTCGERVSEIAANESTYIPASTRHRLENPGAVPLQIIEVQNGAYLEEDDIVRFDDDYGRMPTRIGS